MKIKLTKNLMINNKKLFEGYLIFRLIIIITLVVIIGILFVTLFLKINLYQILLADNENVGRNTLLILSWLSGLFLIIGEKIKPAYIELELIENKIVIKTYSPHQSRWESPFVLFGYKKRIKELKICREEYNDYKLTIGKFGLRKELKLQKANNNGIYESATINISLLGQTNYTNLILAIDRLRTKICLN